MDNLWYEDEDGAVTLSPEATQALAWLLVQDLCEPRWEDYPNVSEGSWDHCVRYVLPIIRKFCRHKAENHVGGCDELDELLYVMTRTKV